MPLSQRSCCYFGWRGPSQALLCCIMTLLPFRPYKVSEIHQDVHKITERLWQVFKMLRWCPSLPHATCQPSASPDDLTSWQAFNAHSKRNLPALVTAAHQPVDKPDLPDYNCYSLNSLAATETHRVSYSSCSRSGLLWMICSCLLDAKVGGAMCAYMQIN